MRPFVNLFVLVVYLCVAALLLSGCSRRMIDFTIISSKNTQLQIPQEAMGERVEGEDTVLWLFIGFGYIPLGTPEIKEAVDKAIQSAGPGYDALVDGVLYQVSAYYLLTMKTGYKVVGTPIKTSLVNRSAASGIRSSVERPMLYHSSLGISNETALANLKIIKEDKPAPSD